MYRVTHQVSDYILLTLIWEFHHVAYMPWQFCQICSCPSRIRQTSQLSNQSQQNVVTDLTGHPVCGWCCDSNFLTARSAWDFQYQWRERAQFSPTKSQNWTPDFNAMQTRQVKADNRFLREVASLMNNGPFRRSHLKRRPDVNFRYPARCWSKDPFVRILLHLPYLWSA